MYNNITKLKLSKNTKEDNGKIMSESDSISILLFKRVHLVYECKKST